MSNIACDTYGINFKLFKRVCPTDNKATAEGFARIYIAGLQQLVGELDAKLDAEKNQNKLLLDRLKDKEELIEILKQSRVN